MSEYSYPKAQVLEGEQLKRPTSIFFSGYFFVKKYDRKCDHKYITNILLLFTL